MSTAQQRLAREAAEIARSLNEDLERLKAPVTMSFEKHYGQRLEAIEAALLVLLNAIAETE